MDIYDDEYPFSQVSIIHAFRLSELFLNFRTEMLVTPRKVYWKLCHDRHLTEFVQGLFAEALALVVDDIIDSGVEFKFPNSSIGKSRLCMQKISDDTYIKMRKGGAWRIFDPFETYFSAYRLVYLAESRKKNDGIRYHEVPVHVDRARTARIVEKAKKGRLKVGRITVYQDYYDILKSRYPTIYRKDLMWILNYGFNAIRMHFEYGGDMYIRSKDLLFLTGYVSTYKLRYFKYISYKARVRARVLYRRLRIVWDGTYYFSVPAYRLRQLETPVREGQMTDFGMVYLHKIYDEVIFDCKFNCLIFKVRVDDPRGLYGEYRHLVTDKAELIETMHDKGWDEYDLYNRRYQVIKGCNVALPKIKRENTTPYYTRLKQILRQKTRLRKEQQRKKDG